MRYRTQAEHGSGTRASTLAVTQELLEHLREQMRREASKGTEHQPAPTGPRVTKKRIPADTIPSRIMAEQRLKQFNIYSRPESEGGNYLNWQRSLRTASPR